MPFTPVKPDSSDYLFGRAPLDTTAFGAADSMLRDLNAASAQAPAAGRQVQSVFTPEQRRRMAQERRIQQGLEERKNALAIARRGDPVYIVYPKDETGIGGTPGGSAVYDLEHPEAVYPDSLPGGQFDPAIQRRIADFRGRVAPMAEGKLQLTPAQQLAYISGNFYPPLLGFAGGLMGGGKQLMGALAAYKTGNPAAIGEELSQTLPGITLGSAAGRLTGAGLRYAQFKAAGLPVVEDPAEVAKHLALQTVIGGTEGVVQGMTGPMVNRAGQAIVKSTIGQAEALVPQWMKKWDIDVSLANFRKGGRIDTMIDKFNDESKLIAGQLTREGTRIPVEAVAEKLRIRVGSLASSQVVDDNYRKLLNDELDRVLGNLRGGVQASTSGGRGTFSYQTEITPSKLQEIASTELQAVRRSVAARAATNSAADKLTPLTPQEQAQYDVYRQARQLLGELDPRLQQYGQDMHELFTVRTTLANVATAPGRSATRGLSQAAGVGALVQTSMGHPERTLPMLGIAGAIDLMGQPYPLSRLGLLMQNPIVAQSVANAPRFGTGFFDIANEPYPSDAIPFPGVGNVPLSPLASPASAEAQWYRRYNRPVP